MSLSPTLTFSLMLATFIGALANALIGGDGRKLLLFILAAWVGFGLGQAIGTVAGLEVFTVGTVNAFAGSLGSILAIGAAFFLSRSTR